MNTEFAFLCKICSHSEAWTTEGAAQAAAWWHAFENHRDRWIEAMGTGMPNVPRPEQRGRRFEDWERQS